MRSDGNAITPALNSMCGSNVITSMESLMQHVVRNLMSQICLMQRILIPAMVTNQTIFTIVLGLRTYTLQLVKSM